MTAPSFALPMQVRDYECDLQGVVNNAVYQNYLEHARHVFLQTCGIDFAALVQENVNLVVTRAELDYVLPLRPGDEFTVTVALERVSRLRFGFRQTITRVRDGKTLLRAFVVGTALDARGRPHLPAQVEQVLENAAGSEPVI